VTGQFIADFTAHIIQHNDEQRTNTKDAQDEYG
jgi:hypothetical protein